jgi:hypothetical protein
MTRRGRERAREIWTGSRVDSLGPENLAAARGAGYEPDGDWLVGRDPRRMTRAEVEAIGHEPMSPIQVIRAKCLDCCAGSSDEVRKCVAMACPLWPFRTGKNPWRAPVSEERREASGPRPLSRSLIKLRLPAQCRLGLMSVTRPPTPRALSPHFYRDPM